MNTHFIYSGLEGINNELDSVTRKLFNDFLNYMVAVLILNTLHHSWFQLIDQILLLYGCQYFQTFLHNSATILILRELPHVAFDDVVQLSPLIEVSIFEHLLHDIISEDILDKLV